MDVEFAGYRCDCRDLKTPPDTLAYRRDTFTCVVRNYIAYLKARKMTAYVDTRKLERLLVHSSSKCDVFNIAWSGATSDVAAERVDRVVLCVRSPVCRTPIAKHLDAQCCTEFIGFVRKHINADVAAADDVRASNEFLKWVAPKRF